MRRVNRVLLSLLIAAALPAGLLPACSGEPSTEAPNASLAQRLSPPPSTGAYASGVYRNLFREWNPSLTGADVQAKLDQLFNHYFRGDPSTAAIYYPAGSNANGPLAYIHDVGNGDVRSEGMSYGMMIAVQLGKKAEFDALWNWAKTYMQHQGTEWDGYFAWQCSTRGRKVSKVPASDGEEYFATALFFAAHRWGNGSGIYDYKVEANRILNTMLHKEEMNGGVVGGVTNMFNRTEKQVVFVPYYSSATHTDPSYHLPAFYELWGRWAEGYNGQQAADRQFWRDAAVKSRQFFGWTAHPVTGLSPDYAEFNGTPKGDASGDNGTHDDFRFDAWRTAVNWAVDYAWWAADASEIARTDRLQAFFQAQGLATYANQYTLDGTPLSSDHSPGLVASNGAASLSASDARADDFVAALWNLPPSSGTWRYYDGVLHMLAALHAAGSFRIWDAPPDPCAPLTTCSGSCVDTETDEAHCGGCGNACAPGANCEGGTCVLSCGPGLEPCSGVCVDTQTNPAHCGACDNACPSGICSNATCQGGAGVFQMIDAQVVMEAEHFAAQVSNGSTDVWTLTADGAASGGQRIDLLPNDGSTWGSSVETTSPRVDYRVNFTSTGTFKFYIRSTGASRSDDGVWGGVDNVHIGTAFAPSSNGTLSWGYRNVSVATPGIHTVSLWGFEDGVRIDKIVLTKGTAPSGTGPAESPQQ